MAVNGKNKGGTFERKIANMLSARFELVTGLKQSFRRNADSGAFFGGSNKKRTATHDLDTANFGDLICPKSFKFSIECKFYKTGPTFSALVKGKLPQWDTWIKQATQDATESKKQMMLIIKYNNVDEVVALNFTLPNQQPFMIYENVFLYRLSDVLLQPDEFFLDC